MLASNFRIATQDVDAVAAESQSLVDELAAVVQGDLNLPADWFNDGVRTFLSPNVDGFGQAHALFRSYPSEQAPGLRVFVPVPEYLLAMKLMAMRIDPGSEKSDVQDILSLIDVVGVRDKRELLALAQSFYPEARVSGRLLLGLDVIWSNVLTRRGQAGHAAQDGHEPPRYLGRGRTQTP